MKSQNKNQIFLKLTVVSILIALITISCDPVTSPRDRVAPPVPSGLISTTGDGVIWLEWDPIIGVPDFEGYILYRSVDDYEYFELALISNRYSEFSDYDVQNGHTYYYGISSVDYSGNESDVSFDYEAVFDTPRPQGWDVVIYSFDEAPYNDRSGFDFSTEERLPYNSIRTDFFLDYDNTPGINSYFLTLGENGSGIQDMGHSESLYDISFAPLDGWSSLDYVEVIKGHIYIIRTMDNHYAMIRVTELFDTPARSIMFDWAYQIARGNRELKIEPPSDVVSALSVNGDLN